MRKSLVIPVILFWALSASSCKKDNCKTAEGYRKQEERALSNFDVIELNISATLRLKQDTVLREPKVVVTAQEDILSEIKTSNRGNTLQIGFGKCVSQHSSIFIDVTYSNLSEIRINGAGIVSTLERINSDELKIISSGVGDCNLLINSRKLHVIHAGSGDLICEGEVDTLFVQSSNSGTIQLRKMPSYVADIQSSGTSSIFIHTRDSLSGNIGGSSILYYTGFPIISATKQGNGRIINNN